MSTEMPAPMRRLLVPAADASAFALVAVEHDLVLPGYQLYAVEKWIVERTRPTTLLVVYTDNASDKVRLTALSADPSLSPAQAEQAWTDATGQYQRDGARARETARGVVMVTSLASFRSDYTVVQIPGGDVMPYREQLYANIGLLRMGCSGRAALSLQDPSDATRDRFVSVYALDEWRGSHVMRGVVVRAVSVMQGCLCLFDLFPLERTHHDGLLCDVTVAGLDRWIAQIGKPYLQIEHHPYDKSADPSVVAALLSLVLAVRNRLSLLGFSPPKDPVRHPRRFARALAAFVNQRLFAAAAVPALCNYAFINTPLLTHIDYAFLKHRASDPYRLHRVVLSKLDDFTAATSSAIAPTSKAATAAAAAAASAATHKKASSSLSASNTKDRDLDALVDPTTDLAAFVARFPYTRDKESFASVRALWQGRLDVLQPSRRKAANANAQHSDAEDDRERGEDDEDDAAELASSLPWSNRVTRTFEYWTGKEFGRRGSKKSSVDLAKDKTKPIPALILSKDLDESWSAISSGLPSPLSRSRSISAIDGYPSAHNSSTAFDPDAISQRLSQFKHKDKQQLQQHRHPWQNGSRPRLLQSASWSDRLSALVQNEQSPTMDASCQHAIGSQSPDLALPWHTASISAAAHDLLAPQAPRSVPFMCQRKRSYSFDDREYLSLFDILSPERMQVDVELCTQYLVTRRRASHVKAVMALLQSLVPTTSSTNEALRTYHSTHAPSVHTLTQRGHVSAADIEKALAASEAISAETSALAYETGFLDVASLWRTAQGPRHRVFAIRDRVFGSGAIARRGQGKGRGKAKVPWILGGGGGAGGEVHGRFNRVQRTLDGRRRHVDFLGRTESDVEEESALPVVDHLRGPEAEFSRSLSHASEDEYEGEQHARAGEGTGLFGLGAWEGEEEGRLRAASSWLLTLFSQWGSVLGVGRGGGDVSGKGKSKVERGAAGGQEQEEEEEDVIGRVASLADDKESEEYDAGSGKELQFVGEDELEDEDDEGEGEEGAEGGERVDVDTSAEGKRERGFGHGLRSSENESSELRSRANRLSTVGEETEPEDATV